MRPSIEAGRGQAAPRTSDQQAAADNKKYETLRARIALRGHQVFRVGEPGEQPRYYVSRWGLFREIRGGLHGLEQWAQGIGA